MTVSTSYAPLTYAGNAATTAFAVTWPFFTGSLVVTLIASTGVETVKSLTTHYTVSGGTTAAGLPATGTVTMLTAPAVGETLQITRVTPKTQGSTWAENDPFPQKVIEAALDRLTLQTQESSSDAGLPFVTAGAVDYWDAESQIIRNVADAVLPTDVVNYRQLQSEALSIGTGNVVGPVSATDNALVRFDAATGKLVKNSPITVSDEGEMSGASATPSGGSTARALASIFADKLNVKDFGAAGDGSTADNAALDAMIAAVGYARFSPGSYALNTDTFDAPLVFDYGANLVALSGQTVTISARIEAPRYHIFQGSGTYSLTNDTNSGEDSREVHATWFNIVPTASGGTTDMGPRIQAAFNAMGTGRESIVQFDIGNYLVNSAVTITRGGHIKGDGTRRTVFRTTENTLDMFTSAEVACRWTDIQFEFYGSDPYLTGSWITIAHDGCEVYNIDGGNATCTVEINSTNARVRNVNGVFSANGSTGSSLVRVSNAQAVVDGVACLTSSAFGPSAMVIIGGSGSAAVSGAQVNSINYISPSRAVHVYAASGSIARCMISNVTYNGYAGTAPDECILIETDSAFAVDDIIMNDLMIGSYIDDGVRIRSSGSANINRITIDTATLRGVGTAIDIVESGSGGIDEINIGDSVHVNASATPLATSGSVTDISIPPTFYTEGQHPRIERYTVADDAAVSVNLFRSVFSGIVIVNAGSANYGLFSVRAASTPAVVNISVSANVASTNVSLSGTTGTDGRLTVGVTSGALYFENRLGSSQNINIIIMAGA